ncbi:flagellin [Thalassobaculum sp. OXR-137]|uniref:flagellin n=1 Tax=Thalassobaculum sp. OXR-137 TaxID=3100173 RepID=UPI002AC912FA|nr:flagellin [Thalassobaculum sp. OXR-137]WPZ34216.1 flagellin [Thalassobaculum sp. OXR-137]
MAVKNSIRTNVSAFSALHTLNLINRTTEAVQRQVSTGLRVSGALEDASNFAIAQGIRAEIEAYHAVNQGLRTALGLVKVGIAGATVLSDLLTDMREKSIAGRNPGLTDQQRQILTNDFHDLRDQFDQLVIDASFNGTNLINTVSTPITVLTNIQGGTYMIDSYRLQAVDLEFGRPDANLDDLVNAEAADGYVVDAIQTVGIALGGLGASARFIETQIGFNESLQDAAEVGLGNIVDADLARASAELTAQQVRQQLSIETVGIANRRPGALLALFA